MHVMLTAFGVEPTDTVFMAPRTVVVHKPGSQRVEAYRGIGKGLLTHFFRTEQGHCKRLLRYINAECRGCHTMFTAILTTRSSWIRHVQIDLIHTSSALQTKRLSILSDLV